MRLNKSLEPIHYMNRLYRGSNYLVVVLDAHADCIDKDGDHNPSVEVLALHDTPKFHSHFIPKVFTFHQTGAFALLHFSGVLLIPPLIQGVHIPVTPSILPIGRVVRRPRSLFDRQGRGTLRAFLRIWSDREGNGVLESLGAVVQLAFVNTVSRYKTK